VTPLPGAVFVDSCLATCALLLSSWILSNDGGRAVRVADDVLDVYPYKIFIFYMLIEPPNQTFMEFYMNRNFMVSCLGAASNLVYYIAHDLHPSRIVMPLLLLLYSLLLYDSYMHPTMQHAQQVTSQPIFGRHYTVDCRFGLPATYMVFSCIMYVPHYI
jgi:hypothetical protein